MDIRESFLIVFLKEDVDFLGKHLGRPRVGAVGTDERAQCSLGIDLCVFLTDCLRVGTGNIGKG